MTGELPATSAVDTLMAEARTRIDRVRPEDLADEVAAGALVVDIRPEADRRADGPVLGATVVERIHTEWRLDPTSPHRLEGVTADRRVILVCNEGYASSLAAATLVQLGLSRCADLEGGARALFRVPAAGHP